ncbi:MAG: PDDEXK nuclease domain-containing protein [Janthinobacterium lividum]
MVAPDFAALVKRLSSLHTQAQRAAVQQADYQLTLRNWLIGRQLAESEQPDAASATTSPHPVPEPASSLRAEPGLSGPQLAHCLAFYRTYPALFPAGTEGYATLASPTLLAPLPVSARSATGVAAELLRHLSFAHFLELLPLNNVSQRTFYEEQTIRHNWSVRALKQAIDSLLYERLSLSRDKEAVLAEYADATSPATADFFANSGLLDFLGLAEGPHASDQAAAIIPRLRAFLLGLGRGFCFEAASKRLTLGNEPFLVDLVFYHRVLRCHFLLNVRLTALRPADTSYLNACLGYYRENVMAADDNPPVGLLLGVRPAATQVSYLTPGTSAELFARQHRALLPSEAELHALFERA